MQFLIKIHLLNKDLQTHPNKACQEETNHSKILESKLLDRGDHQEEEREME